MIGRSTDTRRIAAERDAQRLNAEIAAERETTRLKSELVTTVSHELRTPLTSVLGFTELLLHRELDDDTRRSYVQTIHDEARRLARLIDDFLDLERIEAGRFTLALESFDLGALLEHQVQLFSAQSANHTIEFAAPDEPLVLMGDRGRIGQVIANLLSNAIKYSPAGGAVSIAATPGDSFVRVEVRDSGLGIPSDQQARVFTRFFRVDSSDTRKIGGTGLGLTLSREIVAAHGGRIGFESTQGVGSAFWFDLPSAAHASLVVSAAPVLVIASHPALAERLSSTSLDGVAMTTALSGRAGIELALALPPALICLDTDLRGELDGWQVLVRLKANPATAHIPVVCWGDASGRGTAATLGAAEFVPESRAAEAICEAVARQLSTGRHTVLVVGDDQGLRRIVVETLARDGGDLREAADELEALSMIAEHQPDALVLDLAQPGSLGFGTIERLLARPETRGLPVVVLTSRALSASEDRFLKERSATCVEKREYSADELRKLVRRTRYAPLVEAVLSPDTDLHTIDMETRGHAL